MKLLPKRSSVFYLLSKRSGGVSALCNRNPSTMAATAMSPFLAPSSSSSSSSLHNFTDFQKLSSLKSLTNPSQFFLPEKHTFRDLGLQNTTTLNLVSWRRLSSSTTSYNAELHHSKRDVKVKKTGQNWRILKRWDVPWDWKIVSVTSVACGLSFYYAGLVQEVAIPYLWINYDELSLDGKAVKLFLQHAITSAAVLGVLYGLTNTFKLKPFPHDIFLYDWRKPFNLQKGWLLWAGIGLVGTAIAMGVIGAAIYLLGKYPKRKNDAVVFFLPFLGSSPVCTASMMGIAGVLAPLLEETVCRGFLMASLTKWVPTPVAVLISAFAFAVGHLTPGLFPQQFVMGTVLGFSYAQTRNLLTPITIHALWNSGVLWLVIFLKRQGVDMEELFRA